MIDELVFLYLILFLNFLTGVESFDSCPYNGILGASTMSCLHGCCGSTFEDACCDAPNVGAIVGGVMGGLFLIATIAFFVCFCFVCKRSTGAGGIRFGTAFSSHTAARPAGQPYTVYPQGTTVGSTTTVPQTVPASGPQTVHPTSYGPGAYSTGPAYPPPATQQSTGFTPTSYTSNEPDKHVLPTAPMPSGDPPPYPGTGSDFPMTGTQYDKSSEFR